MCMIQTFPIFSQDRWLHNFISYVNPEFSDAQLHNASIICQGLLSSLLHKSIASISESLVVSRDQSSLNRFLNESDWGFEISQMDVNRALLMQQHRQTAISSKGVICFDDTLLEKTGSFMELVSNHFDHCSFTMKTGLSLISINYCDETKNYNLFKEVYLRKIYLKEKEELYKFRTKIEIACDMLQILFETMPSIFEVKPHFTFDSWFLAHTITSLLNDHGLKYVSRAKSNRIIEGLCMNLKQYATKILKDTDFKKLSIEGSEKETTLYTYTTILPISNLGDVKVVFVKSKKNHEVSCFLVSNDLRLSSDEIIKIYKARWGIETDYKFHKQNLGLSEFHLRKTKGILRYLTLCFIVSTYLEYCKLMGIFGRSFGKDIDLSTKGKEVRAYRHLMFERFLIWLDQQLSSGTDVYNLLHYFREETVRAPHGIQFVYQSTKLSLKCGAC